MAAVAIESSAKQGKDKTLLIHMIIGLAIFLLFVGEVAIGTNPVFAGLVSSYLIMTWASVTLLGGPQTSGGFLITVMSSAQLTVGQVVKTVLREAPDQVLLAPMETMLAMNLSMAGVLCTSIFFKSMKYEKWSHVFRANLPPHTFRAAAYIILFLAVTGIVIDIVGTARGYYQTGGIFGYGRTFAKTLPLGIGLYTAYSISQKKLAVTPMLIVWLSAALIHATITSTRGNFMAPVIIFLATAVFYRHKFKIFELAFVIAVLVFYQRSFSPFCLYARQGTRSIPLEYRTAKVFELLGEFIVNPNSHKSSDKLADAEKTEFQKNVYYYRTIPRNTTLERLTLLPTIDNIIYVAKDQPKLGFQTTQWSLRQSVPSMFMPDKPQIGTSNQVARQGRGLVGRSDRVTQITMGAVPGSYISFGLPGVFVVFFVITLALIGVVRMLFGYSLIRNILGVGAIFPLVQMLSESDMGGDVVALLNYLPLATLTLLFALWAANGLNKRRSAPEGATGPVL